MKSYRMVDFGAPLEAVESGTPEPTGTQVLLRVRATGVCHSDLHIWEGGYDLGFGRRMSLKDRGIAVPLTLGHETAGEVVAAGPEARGVRPGDVRLVYPWIGCGTCPVCRRGDENLCAKPRFLGVYCDGGYSDHITVPHPRYLLDLDGLDPVGAAPYACSGVTTYGALKKLGDLIAAEPIVVIGAGGLGLMSLSILKALGGKGAIVVDVDARKRRAALECGALAAIDGRDPDALSQITRAAEGPVRGVIDLVGSSESAALASTSCPRAASSSSSACSAAARHGRCPSSRSRPRPSRAATSATSGAARAHGTRSDGRGRAHPGHHPGTRRGECHARRPARRQPRRSCRPHALRTAGRVEKPNPVQTQTPDLEG